MDKVIVLRRVLALLARRDEQESELKATKDKIELDRENLLEVLKPICLAGFDAYNSQPGIVYLISIESFTLDIDFDSRRISAKINLLTKNGKSPVGELDLEDIHRISSSLRSFIGDLLSVRKIPFVFNGVSVPDDHYMK